jgi:hypothetical protein
MTPVTVVVALLDSTNKPNGLLGPVLANQADRHLVRRNYEGLGHVKRGTSTLVLVLAATLLSATFALGQESRFDPHRTLVPISKVKAGIGVTVKFGTGFCLDLNCNFIGTNYHVAIFMGSTLKIKGEKVTETYLYSSQNDEGATLNEAMDSDVAPMKYNLTRDLAIFGLKHPLANKGMRGVTFNVDELEENQEVDIYAYPLTDRLRLKRSLTKFPGRFAGTTHDGILAFRFELSQSGQSIKPGASGGLIIDHKTQEAVAILIGVGKGTSIAAAISVRSLANFLKKVKPGLYADLFPPNEPSDGFSSAQSATDIYARYLPTENLSGSIRPRQEESAEIKHLREKAQELADNIKDFIAVQTLAYGGMKTPPAPSQYEVRVIDGRQQFRAYPNGDKELPNVPLPQSNPVLGSGGEWSTLPTLVGTELKLKLVQVQDAVIGGRKMKVFQYYGDVEDNVCDYESISDYVLFQRVWERPVACGGEVWTDEDFNIIRISENYDLPPAAHWRNYHAVVTYGWLHKQDESRGLVPLEIGAQAELNGKHYWYRGRFTNYQVFTARAKLLH